MFKKNRFLAKAKTLFWPIEMKELKVFLPMASIVFCLLFNFSALRSLKDSLVVPSIGAEVISFLKLWLVLPFAVLFTLLYVKLSNVFDIEKVFYLVITIFLLFFLLFGFVIYPNQEFLHPSEQFVQEYIQRYTHLQWFIKILSKWSYALMYIFCELWSVVVINLIYWQFANSIFTIPDAKRFYPILGMVGNFGLILSGNFLISASDPFESFLPIRHLFNPDHCSSCEAMIKLLVMGVTFFGVSAALIFRYLNQNVIKKSNYHSVNAWNLGTTKTRLSVIESIKLVLNSRYIFCIAMIVICYGLAINILEGPWKAKVKQLYPSTQEYLKFMGQFNIVMGISCVIFMVIGSNILRKFNWLTSALITPSIIGVTGIIFFLLVILGNNFNIHSGQFNPLYLAVLVGALQNILSKSSKYSLFDSTKEIAYMPLDLELKTKGKAAVEIIAMKLGKSAGAFIQSMMFTFIPGANFDSILIILGSVFLVVISVWIMNVYTLFAQYNSTKVI